MAEPADGHGGDPAALAVGYEHLRDAVLAGRPEGWRLGHGVLAGRGMAAWMARWNALAPAPAAGTTAPHGPSDPSTPSPSTSSAHPPATALSSLPAAGEIVAVLAQMALAHA